ncbi:Sm-like protein LSM8 [Porphyridium purpureum]|uniref:U6 snRNA-associated Sm-like protein LSm8 n=1 Tax=Porphyridium purpureum TaxID=35688 RepID=A0A5J4Z4M2_PORPP|nr:Sm-like protein LSM8 [Porphyridium purpureum]|eukprot:POR3068..scf295_1
MAPMLAAFVGKHVSVLTLDGRNVVGELVGFDQTHNLVLRHARERNFERGAAVVHVELGLFLLRGDNLAIVGEISAELDRQTQWSAIRGRSLKPIVH